MILAGAVAAILLRRRTSADAVFQLLAVGGCVVAGVAAVAVLWGAPASILTLRSSVPGGDWIIGLDRLSAAFVIPIVAVGATAVLFGTAYMARERGHRPVWFVHALVAFLLVVLLLVVTAQAVVPFLIAWELMAIASYLLIVTEAEAQEVRRAGLIFIVATHTATLALFAMFSVWTVRAADWSFTSLAAAPLTPSARAAILALAILGFGLKAGIVPFQFWLPPAHAAAPTHVSALLSGVVIKTGIYGLLRVVSLFRDVPAWWGWLVLGLGVASGVLGVLWALAQHDMKRLLAYHSVENIGIILMGIGVGALGTRYGHPVLSVIGYGGALLHTLNHALFKSLLFMGAGVVYRVTGTRVMEQLGGLARRLPWTWPAVLVGAAAIIGIPPLNGFVSEWLVYQGLFRAGQTSEVLRLAVLGVPALALIGALALACFAKVAGVVFLGRPRTIRVEGAREVGPAFLVPMFALAAACILLGVLAPAGVLPAIRAATLVTGGSLSAYPEAVALAREAGWIGGIAIATLTLIGVGWLGRRALLARRTVRIAETWACGYVAPSARMQYTASSFASPLLSAFGRLSGVRVHRTRGAFETHPLDLVLDRVAMPLWAMIQRAALRLRPIQQGRLSAYLIYVLATLVVLLSYVAIAAH
jgi:hydrogenase-4 component B